MSARRNYFIRDAALILLVVAVFATANKAQAQNTNPVRRADDVIRIDTDLVQTHVMVFDKQGRFVEGLNRDQFELRVDSKLMPVAFFERVVAGSAAEAAQMKAVSGVGDSATRTLATTSNVSVRGRTLFFFIDDLHLSLDSLGRTRFAISHFIDHEMGRNDQAGIITASGQIGFLQQLTNNKTVLRAALSRISHKAYTVVDTETPTMTEFMALRIERRDIDAMGYYVGRCLKENPGYPPRKCIQAVTDRARMIIQQASTITIQTLWALEQLTNSSERLAGRKLILLISDGFFMGARDRYANVFEKLPKITDEARRHGAVIYTIDARGLISGQADSMTRLVDGNGLLDRANLGEMPASQDALNALARDTGGRALRNSNSIADWVTNTLKETSNYYLLGWRPEADEQKSSKFKRVEVTVVGRPDLEVRFHRGYLPAKRSTAGIPTAVAFEESRAAQPAAENHQATQASEAEPSNGSASLGLLLPTVLATSYLDVPGSGPVLTSSFQIASNHLKYGDDGKQAAAIDLAGVVLNDQGKQATSFKTRLSVAPQQGSPSSGGQTVIYNHRTALAPGLYQVRIAARDALSGQAGSAMDWIEIPDLTKGELTLSSAHLGEKLIVGASGDKAKKAPEIQFSVDRDFPRNSRLDFVLFVYNATHTTAGNRSASLTTQVQVVDGAGRTVMESGARTLPTKDVADLTRIPITGDFSLRTLAPGAYLLRVSVRDLIAQTTATREVSFTCQ
ncbi:MAG: VWA domain-containing protein [Pyrinomonadaceae bacterium]|nr:VWA domain-containing protein [Pyrinomonadaceae bacterium]